MRWIASLTFAILAASVFGQQTVVETFGDVAVPVHRLLWRNLSPRTEVVTRSGRFMVSERDYQINYQFGLLQLTEPLRASESLRIEYQIAPSSAVRNTSAPILPFDTDLATGKVALSLTGFYQSGVNSPGNSAIGLRGSFNASASWRVLTKLWAESSALSGGDVGSKAALHLGLTGSIGAGKFTAEFAHGGRNLVNPAAFGVKRAEDTLNVAMTWDQKKEWKASIHFTEAAAIGSESGGSQELAMAVGLSPNKALALNAEHKMTWAEGGRWNATDKAKAIVKLPNNAKLSVDWRQISSDSRNDSQANVKVEAGGSLARVVAQYQASDDSGGSRWKGSLNALVTPLAALRFEGSYARSEATSLEETANGRVTFEPVPQFMLAAGIRRATGADETVTQIVEGRVSPNPAMELTGSAHRYYVNESEPTDSITVSGRLRPLAPLSIVGAYSDRPDDSGEPEDLRRKSIGAELKLGSLALTGAYRMHEELSGDASGWGYEVGGKLNIARSTALNASFVRDMNEASYAGTALYKLKLVHKYGALALNLEGHMKQYDFGGVVQSARSEYQGRASLSLRY